MPRFAIDVTACWRPQRVGMLTVAVELSKALVAGRNGDEFTLLCSRERPAALTDLDATGRDAFSRLSLVYSDPSLARYYVLLSQPGRVVVRADAAGFGRRGPRFVCCSRPGATRAATASSSSRRRPGSSASG